MNVHGYHSAQVTNVIFDKNIIMVQNSDKISHVSLSKVEIFDR